MAGGSWRDDRHEITYGEARAVIEAQNRTMADVDEKAIQTVRFNTVLVGLLLAAANVSGPSTFHPTFFGLGIASLAGSMFLGLITYDESNLFVGPRGSYIVALTRGEPPEPWDVDLLESLAAMVSTNDGEIERNAKLLTATQATLVVGVVTAVLSVAI